MVRRAAGGDATALVPTEDAAASAPTDAIDAIGRQAATPTKQRRVGLSARKRKQAREEVAVPAPIDNDIIDEETDAGAVAPNAHDDVAFSDATPESAMTRARAKPMAI